MNRFKGAFALSLALISLVSLAFAAVPAVAGAAKKPKKCSSSLKYKLGVEPRCEQRRYVRETIKMTYSAFESRKQDFTIQGCNADAPQERGCQKPAPYNEFDWTTDGCSGPTGLLPPLGSWNEIFRLPCELHDFGYRNLGKGLTLERTERERVKVDRAFYREMKRVCGAWSSSLERRACKKAAKTMYDAVRTFPGNWWGFS